MEQTHEVFMSEALALAKESAKNGTGPFGCVVVKDGVVIGRGHNQVTGIHDPTAHAEIQAIRDACKTIGSFSLEGATVYSSSYPCPMCLGALYWARPEKVLYSVDIAEAARVGFDDVFMYNEFKKENKDRTLVCEFLDMPDAHEALSIWEQHPNKIMY